MCSLWEKIPLELLDIIQVKEDDALYMKSMCEVCRTQHEFEVALQQMDAKEKELMEEFDQKQAQLTDILAQIRNLRAHRQLMKHDLANLAAPRPIAT